MREFNQFLINNISLTKSSLAIGSGIALIACLSSNANAQTFVPADIIWLIDTSGTRISHKICDRQTQKPYRKWV